MRAIVERAGALHLGDTPVVADLGCGAGDLLAALSRARPICGAGIDISTAAIEIAARRFPTLTWIIANADRRIPLLDCSVDLVLSQHARRNAVECARILVPGGVLLVAVPAPDDLIELRSLVAGAVKPRARGDLVIREHATHFDVIERQVVREQRRLERPQLLAALRATYRGERQSASDMVSQLESMDVTLSSELILMAQR